MDRPYFYLGKSRGLTQLSTGEVFFVDTEAQDISTWILLGGIWETFVDDILCALVRPGDTFLDVGANMGYYSVKMARRVGETGRTFSFEPNPVLYRVLSDNLKINAFHWSTAINAAAGAEAGSSTLSFIRSHPGGGMVGLEYSTPELERVDVQVVRIDDAIPQDLKADLIKIDVEGFEPLVLMGMQGLLARSPDAAIVTEINYAMWARHGDPAALVRSMAGERRIFRIFTDGKIEPMGDGDQLEQTINQLDVCYVLLIPPHRLDTVQRFVRGYVEPSASAPAVVVAPPRPSLLRRILRRLGLG